MWDHNQRCNNCVFPTAGYSRHGEGGRVGKMADEDIETKTTFLPNSTNNTPTRFQDAGKRRWAVVVCVCVLVVDILLGGLVAVLSGRRSAHRKECPGPEKFCLPCESLRLSAGENKQNFEEFGYDRVDRALDGECCAQNPEDLQRLVEIFVKRKQRLRRLKELAALPRPGISTSSSSPLKPAAHLVKMNKSDSVFTEINSEIDMDWDKQSNSSLSFVQGFERRDKGVVILQSGYYYIYSQLMFKEASNSSAVPASLCHFLFRVSSGAPDEKLLQNSVKLVGGASKTPSSYLGAVFHLSKGDVIGIKVSGKGTQLNEQHTHGNFFGLYKV